MAPMDINTAAKLQLTEAETVRLEEFWDAWKGSKTRVADLTDAARELTKEGGSSSVKKTCRCDPLLKKHGTVALGACICGTEMHA